MTPEFSTWLVIIFCIIMVVTDIPLAVDKIKGNTWSEALRNLALGWFPSGAFAMTYVNGHWWMWRLWDYPVWLSFVVLGVNMIVIQLIRYLMKKPFNKYGVGIVSIMGFINGWVFWA